MIYYELLSREAYVNRIKFSLTVLENRNDFDEDTLKFYEELIKRDEENLAKLD